MKKKLSLLIILIFIIFSFTACSKSPTTSQYPNTTSTSSNVTLRSIDQTKPDTYRYTDNPQFVAVTYQHIKDGTTNGLKMIQYVDLNTGTMYLYTEKYLGSYANTFVPLLNPDGTPVVYDDLETLRNKYHWNK